MTDNRYNGWTNYETWLANLWADEAGLNAGAFDIFAMTAEEVQDQLDDGSIASALQDWFESIWDLPETGFAADAVNAALGAVHWQEIARHWAEEVIAEMERNA